MADRPVLINGRWHFSDGKILPRIAGAEDPPEVDPSAGDPPVVDPPAGDPPAEDPVAQARAEAEAARKAASEAQASATAEQATLARERSDLADQKLKFAEQQSRKGDPGFPKEVVDKLRGEAAGYRTKLRDAEAEVQKLRDAAKSDVERLTGAATAAEQRAVAAEQRLLRLTVGRKAGLDDEIAERLVGDTEDQLKEDAKKLAAKFKASGAGLDQGSRGSGTRTAGGGAGAAAAAGGDGRSAMNSFIRSHGGRRELPGQSGATGA